MEDIVIMGKILSPHGIKGWIKVHAFTEKKETLSNYKIWQTSPDEKNWLEYEIEDIQVKNKVLFAKLKNVDDRDSADQLSKSFIGVFKKELPDLEKNQFYWFQLIGLDVKSLTGHRFGKVESILETGANNVLVVKNEKETLVPYIESVILEVDLVAKTIKVDWPDDF
ncbi:MAG: ribosome maturation factor RimM [Methylophilaceae bacterium]|jgi:16S rRNA processing protein RimM